MGASLELNAGRIGTDPVITAGRRDLQTCLLAGAEIDLRVRLDGGVVPRARPAPGHPGDEAAGVLGLRRVEQLYVRRRVDVLNEVIGGPGHAAIGPRLAFERPEL